MSWKKTARMLICLLLVRIFFPIRAQEVPSDVTPFVQLARLVKVSYYEDALMDESGDIVSLGESAEEKIKELPLGSGTIISRDGLILTNYHVCEIDDEFIYDEDREILYEAYPVNPAMFVYALKDNDPLKAPEFSYIATPVCLDEKHDIAILEIIADEDGNEIKKDYFTSVRVGNPFAMRINEDITIIGYPSKGGKTITITDGKFSGYYLDDRFVGLDGFIKTDAAMSPGNSGGAAMHKKRLIGVPTGVTPPASAGSDLGFIYPVTWAVKGLVVAKQKFGFSTPDIPVKWLKSRYNKDETLDRIYITGEIISAHSNNPLSANVIIARRDRTFEQINDLHIQLQLPLLADLIQQLRQSGLSVQDIAREFGISPDVVYCVEGEFFYEITQSDNDGFFILSAPRGKDVNVFVRKYGYHPVEKEEETKTGVTQSLKQIKLYRY